MITADLGKEKRFRGSALLTQHGAVSSMSVVIGPEEAPWGVLGAFARRSILLVDDYSDSGYLHKLLLEQQGYEVSVATSGAEALRLVEDFTPQAALLDLTLGDMDGGVLLERLKARPELQDCLFVCLSGRDAEEVAWRQMGFAHYLQKPAPIEEIDRILRSG